MFGGPEVSYHQTYSVRDWLSILRTSYQTQNIQRKHRTDPFEIIPLQTTRKETNWKNEEALAQAAVTRDGMDQRVQSLIFMMMMMMMIWKFCQFFK